MEDKELVKKVREIAKEFPENDMKRALLLGITDRFVGVKVNSIPISVIQNKIDELDKTYRKILCKEGMSAEKFDKLTRIEIEMETLDELLEERNK